MKGREEWSQVPLKTHWSPQDAAFVCYTSVKSWKLTKSLISCKWIGAEESIAAVISLIPSQTLWLWPHGPWPQMLLPNESCSAKFIFFFFISLNAQHLNKGRNAGYRIIYFTTVWRNLHITTAWRNLHMTTECRNLHMATVWRNLHLTTGCRNLHMNTAWRNLHMTPMWRNLHMVTVWVGTTFTHHCDW